MDIRCVVLGFQALLIETEVTVNILRNRHRPPFRSSLIRLKKEVKLNFEISSLGTGGDTRPRKFLVSEGLAS